MPVQHRETLQANSFEMRKQTKWQARVPGMEPSGKQGAGVTLKPGFI